MSTTRSVPAPQAWSHGCQDDPDPDPDPHIQSIRAPSPCEALTVEDAGAHGFEEDQGLVQTLRVIVLCCRRVRQRAVRCRGFRT